MVAKIKYKAQISLVILVIIVVTAGFYVGKDLKSKKELKKAGIALAENDLDLICGADSAQLSVFMFSSYECSFCRKFLLEVFPDLKNDFIDKGIVKLIIKPIVLSNNESVINSIKLAVCINKLGNFEKLNELLLKEPKVIYTEEFDNLMNDLTTEDSFVAECIYGGESENYIMKNIVEFNSLGLHGTPTFIINNKIIKGYKDYETMKKLIKKEL